MPMDFVESLKGKNAGLAVAFDTLVNEIQPLLESIENQFPDYTRHDPAHNLKLETIAADILKPAIVSALSGSDLFVLLSALWIHDAGMGVDPTLRRECEQRPDYREKLASFRRAGGDDEACWRQYVRDEHPHFARRIAERILGARVTPFLVEWVGRIAESHGAREIHLQEHWPATVAVGDREQIHPPLLAATLRLADILHFNAERAPEFMLEHRAIQNTTSQAHWRAHQVAADYVIADDICNFDGVTKDDEAFWFAAQFVYAMDEELEYCQRLVFPLLSGDFKAPLTFSRVTSRIRCDGFAGDKPVVLRVEPSKFLDDLLNVSLYAGQPVWFREAVQNAFDACRDRNSIEPDSTPRVRIAVDSLGETITFEDSGIGMQRRTVEDYMLVAGASYWSSVEYRGLAENPPGHVGKFGVGFMSLFAVADRITVSTRHASASSGNLFLIRDSKRVVRVECAERSDAGTDVTIRLRLGTLSRLDITELFDKYCAFPEFPIALLVDGVTEREVLHPNPPSVKSGLALKQIADTTRKVRLLARDVHRNGIQGDFYLPMIHLQTLDAFVPNMRGWLKSAGWMLKGDSATIFGGVAYPAIHALENLIGFTSVPSLGVLRLTVSPDVFPLEMNLARDRFVKGPASIRYHAEICSILDEVLTQDLTAELTGKSDPRQRSAIASRYSGSMLGLWLGHVPGLTAVPSGGARPQHNIDNTPWPLLTDVFSGELRFLCQDAAGHRADWSIAELVAAGRTVFAAGLTGSAVSDAFVRSVFTSAPEALLILARPDADFGILELRLWASEEFLIPVLEHRRSAYGVALTTTARPYPFYPSECDRFGFPVASGPESFAVLDYRDFMAEAKHQPTGGPQIVGVLNRRNPKVLALINAMGVFADFNALGRAAGVSAKGLRAALVLGSDHNYIPNNRTRLADALNALAQVLGVDLGFTPDDMPPYFDGGTVVPFGLGLINDVAVRAFRELSTLEQPFQRLS